MKALKIIAVLFGILLLLVLLSGTYVYFGLPKAAEPENLTIRATPERLKNGAYLANHVAACMDCHSSRDWSRFAGPMKNTGKGAGGEVFNQDMGFPGSFHARNITPYSLGDWTDGEIFRAITAGINKEGKALFPVMASHRFGKMDKEDIYDIIVYLRSLQPVKNDVPPSKADFPVNILINTMPVEPSFQQKPPVTDKIRYGAYLVNAAGCVDCHSQTDKGNIITGTEFGGGMEFKQPAGILRSPNITPDPKTGIGNWTKDVFVSRFKAYADSVYTAPVVKAGEVNTAMPWTMYAGMKSSDLEAIYDYLKSLKPISNEVLRFTPPSK